MKKSIVLISLPAVLIGGIAATHFFDKLRINRETKEKIRHQKYHKLLLHWLSLKNECKSLEQYFIDNSYKSVAIYGMGEAGWRLYEDLKNTAIEVKYGIDRGDCFGSEIEIMFPDDDLEKVDVIVITALSDYENIKEQLSDRVAYDIVSLEDVVFGV